MSPMSSSADRDAHGANVFSPRSKTWTFPNLKTPAGPAEVYLAVEEEEEEEVSFGSPFRAVRTLDSAHNHVSAVDDVAEM